MSNGNDNNSNNNLISLDIIINIVPAFLFYLSYLKLNKPQIEITQRVYILFTFFCVFIMMYFIVRDKNKDFSFEINVTLFLVGGIMNGVTLAMLGGRLQSKLIEPSKWFLLTIFFYATIQSLIFLRYVPNELSKEIDQQKENIQLAETVKMQKDSIITSNSLEVLTLGRMKDNNDKAVSEAKRHLGKLEKINKWLFYVVEIRIWLLAIGKCVLLWFIIWLYTEGSLLNYFVTNRYSSEELNKFHMYKY